MNTIIIPTAQNIELEYPIAGSGDRISAGLIDWVVQIGYLILLALVNDGLNSPMDETAWIFATLPFTCYHLACETVLNGRSLGKYVMKMQVVQMDGSAATLSSYLLRWTLRIVDVWMSLILMAPGAIGLIAMSVNKHGQRLGDMLAGTTVIKLKLVTTFGDTIFRETGENYEVAFPEIQMLSDKDMSILKEVLDAGLRSDNPDLLYRLADKVKEVAGIQTHLLPQPFLETVLRDYNHVFGKA